MRQPGRLQSSSSSWSASCATSSYEVEQDASDPDSAFGPMKRGGVVKNFLPYAPIKLGSAYYKRLTSAEPEQASRSQLCSSKLSSRSLRLGNKELLHTTQLQTALYAASGER
jgi:hypothetical protein